MGENRTAAAIPAAAGLRLGALLMDLLLVAPAAGILGAITAKAIELSLFLAGADVDLPGLGGLLATALVLLYKAGLEASGGQTIAKRLMRLRVVRGPGDDAAVGMRAALRRNLWLLPAAIPMLGWLVTLVLGILILRRIGRGGAPRNDRAAGTRVVQE